MDPRSDAAASTREVLLAEAERMAADRPWHEVTMAALAAAAGVSRQTVYNEFGSKQGLAQAVALELTGRVLDDVLAAMDGESDLRVALQAGLVAAFAHADASPLVLAVMTGRSGPEGLLTVVTTDASPILELAGGILTSTVVDRWPEVDPDRVPPLADAAIRLVVSHLLQPGPPRAVAAAEIAWMVATGARADASPPARRRRGAVEEG